MLLTALRLEYTITAVELLDACMLPSSTKDHNLHSWYSLNRNLSDFYQTQRFTEGRWDHSVLCFCFLFVCLVFWVLVLVFVFLFVCFKDSFFFRYVTLVA